MKIYYIYHLKGKKIGCTQYLKRRTKMQGFDNNYEILEEHTDIYLASKRERELQKEWGYKVDTKPYWQTIKIATKDSRIKGGKISGKIVGKRNVDSGHMSRLGNAHIKSGHLERIRKLRQRSIIQMDKFGNTINHYPSAKMAGNDLDLWSTNIAKCCKGKLKSTGGYIFRYS